MVEVGNFVGRMVFFWVGWVWLLRNMVKSEGCQL